MKRWLITVILTAVAGPLAANDTVPALTMTDVAARELQQGGAFNLSSSAARDSTPAASAEASPKKAAEEEPKSAPRANRPEISGLEIGGALKKTPEPPPPLYDSQLLIAQRMRLEKDTKQAAKTLENLLESRAPDILKRTALLELALVARDDNDLMRAQQIYAQWLDRYPNDRSMLAVLLQQGLLYRKMGADTLALAKFYAVMSSAVNLAPDRLPEYQRLVLMAQTEIAETYFLQAKYQEAADFYRRLLKLDSAELNKAQIQFKLIRTLAFLNQHAEIASQAQDFLTRYPEAGELAEVRFRLARAYKQLGRNADSLQQVLVLLENKSQSASQSPADWAYWQQLTGNEIANQLYQEGDYLKALMIYENLAKLDSSAQWQLPVWYQIGLVYERLNQPQKADEYYNRIMQREKELNDGTPPSLRTVADMAKWRKGYLQWEVAADKKSRVLRDGGEEKP